MERYKRAADSNPDQYVLTVFLPLLSVAILACIGGCFYMERRRRRRRKRNGGIDPEELRHQQDIDDATSVISTSSSKRRHYLDPTPTTGRTVRGASVRSSYSHFGEPLYEAEKRRRSSFASQNRHLNMNMMLHEQPGSRPSSRQSHGYGERPLSRARSMTDLRYSGDADRGSLRRSRSSNSFGRMSSDFADSGYNDNQSNSETENTYEFLNAKPEKEAKNPPSFGYNRPPSPTQSAYSIRTAPSRTGHDNYLTNNIRPQSTFQELSDRTHRSYQDRPLSRSMSQPNLSRIVDSKTYPQGILKKDTTSDPRNRYSSGFHYNYSANDGNAHDKSNYSGSYTQRPRSSRQQHKEGQSNARPSSRPSSALSYRPQTSYDPYYAQQYGDYTTYGNYGQAPAYAATGYHRHHQLPGKYAASYDQYGNYNDYWASYPHNHRMSMY